MKLDWMGDLFIDDRFDMIVSRFEDTELKLKWHQLIYLKFLSKVLK